VQDVLRDRSLKNSLTWDRRLSFALDSCIGMVYLHHLNIIHRDMKSGNLFVDRNWRVAVGDFGLSVTTREFHGSGPIGTVGYIAPELIQGNEANFASDVFSYGMTLWEIFTGEILIDHLPRDEFSINSCILGGERYGNANRNYNLEYEIKINNLLQTSYSSLFPCGTSKFD
jgi:serine/threonine protein kinase